MVTLVRLAFIVMKNTLGYAFGYQGTGFRADNPKYMIRAQFPELIPIFGLVGSGLFGLPYCCNNVVMSAKSKKWNKKLMLSVALFGMSLSMLGTWASNSLTQFAFNRFLFGVFSAGINAPIYQLIATNFPQKYRSTANAIENSGYFVGAGLASFMIIAIKNYGWRFAYLLSGISGMTLFVLNLLFIKNPAASDPEPKISEEDEDKLLNTQIRIQADE